MRRSSVSPETSAFTGKIAGSSDNALLVLICSAASDLDRAAASSLRFRVVCIGACLLGVQAAEAERVA
jgi:hypothetical protein